jgi:hypothetical protein
MEAGEGREQDAEALPAHNADGRKPFAARAAPTVNIAIDGGNSHPARGQSRDLRG